MIHLDKPYYVAGETAYYKWYFPKNLESTTFMLEIQIFDGNGSLVTKSYLQKGKESHVNGHYKISFEAESGVYSLVASALVEKTKEFSILGRSSMAVYNDNKPVPLLSDAVKRSVDRSGQSLAQLYVSVNLQKQTIRTREPIDVIIDVHDEQGNPVEGNLSIAVTDIGLIGESESYPYYTITESPISLSPGASLSEYIPVSGKLENGQDDQLMTFFMPSANQIYYTTSEAGGNFQLLIPGFFGAQSLQYIGAFSDSTKMELDRNNTITVSEEVVYPEFVKAYLQESSKRKLIYQLYNRVESVYSYEIQEMPKMAAPDRSFKATDYPFENIPSFCKALSTPLKYLKEKKGDFEFRMFNPESRNFYFGIPLFIIDGQMTKDVAFLSTLDFQSIDEISLYYDNLRLSNNFGFAGFSGVVIITSKDGGLEVPVAQSTQVFQVNGMQPKIVETANDNHEAPILKPQLVWEPTLNTNSNGHLEYSYQQSDDISQFQIEVVVQAKDGRRGYGRLAYRIVD